MKTEKKKKHIFTKQSKKLIDDINYCQEMLFPSQIYVAFM